MSRITKFSQITAQLKYPPAVKAQLIQIHSEIVTTIINKQTFTNKELKSVVQIVNTLSYRVLNHEDLGWNSAFPLSCNTLVDDIVVREYLSPKSMYVAFNDINWESDGITKIASADATPVELTPLPQLSTANIPKPKISSESVLTPKENLYIQPPVIPRFSTKDLYASINYDESLHCIYKSLPTVPTKQNEISITTDVSMMTSRDLMKLYPKQFIRTRSAAAYEYSYELEYDEKLGLILPIKNYTRAQLIDNLIKYPHLYKLMKVVDGEIVNFYTTIEIDGELHKTSEVWKTLPEASKIPYNTDLVKEYVVRRYLLERDVDNVVHKYPMFGTLDPFLTLFTTPEDYAQYGYTNAEELARCCVRSRVSYKQSRNPILRRLKNA